MQACALSHPVAKGALAVVEAIRIQYLEQLLIYENAPQKFTISQDKILHLTFFGSTTLDNKTI
jgi:predicted short-subunit dehydrogenase-like oxidoreductase (DUF2520 family)